MAVIVLMYHHTPAGAPEGFYDVGLAAFRDQIRALRDAGVSFVKFSECDRPELARAGTHVALTFDDGHASNAAAFHFLADEGLTPTAFVVRDWSARDPRYLSGRALGDLKGVCELGGHGATHRALTSLADAELDDELAASRDYVGAIVGAGPVKTMALPGGHGGRRELAAALRAGFTLVGNSRPLPHTTPGVGVNRICVNRTHDARAPLRWAQAGALHWTALRARLTATAAGRRLLGESLYGALTALAK
ncbi:MAG: polysaccharide deacetylase family protein [Pseudomonadota bacterium]|nr:polysaccharide deacetylase family protein [Pseudomonadota bacterium]